MDNTSNNNNNNGSRSGGGSSRSPNHNGSASGDTIRGAIGFQDGSSVPGPLAAGSQMMNMNVNPMAFMAQFPGVMGGMMGMPTQDMMNMMALTSNGFGMGMGTNMGMGALYQNPPAQVTQGRGSQVQNMAEMMLSKRRIDDAVKDDSRKRPNLGTSPVEAEEASNGGGNAAGNSAVSSAANLDGDAKPAALADAPAPAASSPKFVAPVPPSKEGIKFYSRNDVLCGRGGGTNVHPGNRCFRDLINTNRRAYLKARKNDKPAISRSIVRTIREMNGRFLKKDEKLGVWLEIGDDSAREKTSQALRQRAPEMRKILFEDEQRQQQQRQQLMGMAAGQGMPSMGGNFQVPPAAMAANMGNFAAAMGMGNQTTADNDPHALLAKYNMIHQKNWVAQEKNMLLQRLAMSGMNPNGVNNFQNGNIDTTISQQGIKQEASQSA